MSRLYCLFLSLLFVPLSGQTLNITSFELPNGLKVVLSPANDMQLVAVCVYNMTGARSDPADAQGISYLYQYLMFDGNENLESYDHILFINKMGGVVSGRVNFDNSIFYELLPAAEINVALWLESERLKSLRLEDVDIDSHKNEIHSRISRLWDTNLSFRAQTWIGAKVFEGTPYATPFYGELNRIRALNNDRIREGYRKFQDLSSILLIIAGKFDINGVKAGINKFFQNIPPGRRVPEVPLNAVGQHTIYSVKNWLIPGLKVNSTFFGIKSPGKVSYGYLFFDFLRYYLTDPRCSRLEHILNKLNKLNVVIEATFTDYFESNVLTIQLSSSERVNLERAKYIVAREFSALTQKPISNSELRAVRTLMELDLYKSAYDPEERCQRIGEFYHMFGELDFLDPQLKRIRRINTYDVMESAKKHLLKENQVVLNVYGD